MFSVTLKWTRLEFRIYIMAGWKVVSQSLSIETETSHVSGIRTLNPVPPPPQILKDRVFLLPLGCIIVGAQHRGAQRRREGWVNGEK